jgi:thioredoxin reductase (NADPH)
VADVLDSPFLSPAQLEVLRTIGEERLAELGESLYRVGDLDFPFVAILEGEVAVLDSTDREIARHGASQFLGEMNLLSGQSLLVSAVAATDLRYIAVERGPLRDPLFEDASFGDLLLSTFVARREAMQQVDDIGLEIFGPHSLAATRRMLAFARGNRLPYSWHDPEKDDPDAVALLEGLDGEALPVVRLPGGIEMQAPSVGDLSRALGIGRELTDEQVDLLVVGAGPAGLGAAVYAASEGLDTLIVEGNALGGQAGTSRRIENYLGFPAGISGTELTGRAVMQARKFGARPASPYTAVALRPGPERHVVRLAEGQEISATAVVLATGAQYRRLDVDGLSDYEGRSVFYAAGPPEQVLCGGLRVGVVGGGNSAAQAAVWLARGGALVTLLHRRADLGETMSAYLVRDLRRHGVAVRDHSEVAELHGERGQLEGVTLKDGRRLSLSYLFLFLGADPRTEWLHEAIACDGDGFIRTGTDAGGGDLLETSVPGVYAAGDVRAGSTKRCAAAVGEGAMVVQFVHARMSRREKAAGRWTRRRSETANRNHDTMGARE